MKVKEKIAERRGRPRKYHLGEVRYRVLWAPENLLMELRVAARIRGVSMNDEVVSRLVHSMDYSPKKPIIKTEEGERFVALTRLFDEFIQEHLAMLRDKYLPEPSSKSAPREFVAGKMKRFSSSFPMNLKKDMEINAQFNQRSVNQEIVQRLLGSLNYLTDKQFPESEEIQRLRALALLFDEFVTAKVGEAENPLMRDSQEKI